MSRIKKNYQLTLEMIAWVAMVMAVISARGKGITWPLQVLFWIIDVRPQTIKRTIGEKEDEKERERERERERG